MADDQITRKDVDGLSANILINFGIINAAALAATFANVEGFEDHAWPFAIGLMCAVISQCYWYFHTAIEYGLKDSRQKMLFAWLDSSECFILSLAIIILGAISGGCIIYGALSILNFVPLAAFSVSLILVFLPLLLLAVHRYKTQDDHPL